MFQTFKNAFKIPDLRKKILFTLFIILLYRIGSAIPVPFVNGNMLEFFTEYGTATSGQGGIFDLLNTMSGGAMSQATLFALGVQPYINASIIIQLLTIAIPALENLSKQGEEGKKKLNTITRFVTVALALIMSIGYYMLLKNEAFGLPVLNNTTWFAGVVIVACYCAGASLVMWLAEKINESGIGNGISIILFANIIARLPSGAASVWMTAMNMFKQGGVHIALGILFIIAIVVVMVALVGFVVFITESERRIPVQYAKRVVGRKMYGGQSSTLPIKLNMTGVMPIIFASTICSLPSTILMFITKPESGFGLTVYNFFDTVFNPNTSVVYIILYLILIIAFAYFYVAISFNPVEVANNIKKNGGSIVGIRPGKPTADFISKVLSKITLIGAIFLGFIAAFPMVLNLINSGMFGSIAFGGSSLLIVVGVALETVREIEAQMTMRHYKGFLD
ncbi:MAG: preprotein translocase subunit SecY [Clostridia bacterium]|nr:preprotein translocase subunit SecY [Clostridia bacterium]